MLTSLRGKLIFIFILLTVSVAIVSTGFSRYKQRQFALDRAQERAEVDLQLLDSGIRSLCSWIKRDLLMLRNLSSLQEMLEEDTEGKRLDALHELQETFLSLATNHKIFQQIRFIDSTGLEIIRVNNREGKIWLTPNHLLQNKSDRRYFKEAIHLPVDQIYISPMTLNIEQETLPLPLTPVIRYALPVTDSKGDKRGILVLNIFGKTFLNILEEQQKKVSPGTQYFLLNKNGYFLFHRDSQKTFGFMLDRNDNFFNDEPGLKDFLLNNSQGVRLRTSEDTYRQTLFAFKRINLSPEEGTELNYHWLLMTTVDNAELLVGMNEYIQAFVPFTLFLIVLCIGAAILVAWNCSRPIVSLASAAKQIQSGDLSARAQVYTVDDMGKFGHLFNEMAAKLELTINRLQLSEAKYRQLFENSKDCIFVTNAQCVIIDINSAGKKLLGIDEYSDVDQLSLNCCQTAFGESSSPFLKEDIQEKGYVKDYETWLQRPDGTTRHCILTATSRYDDHNVLQGYEGILRDITEEKKRQQADLELRKKLQEEIILAEERERRHIGQVLHEEMAQNLALVNLSLQEVETSTKDLQPDIRRIINEELKIIKTMIRVMIRQIRTMIFDLYPVILDDEGLIPAMNWYSDNFTCQTGIEVSVYGTPGSLGLSESQRIYIFRSYKELLHNAWKHADAKEIVATVKKTGHHIRLTVDDEGKGFIPEEITPGTEDFKGIGLISIRQWVTSLHGTMSVESEPGKGTRISIDIPLEQSEEDS